MHQTPCPQCQRLNRVPVEHLADRGKCGACGASFSPLAEPLAVDEETFDRVVAGARVPVLVDFWAAWCGPCRMAAPEVARTAREMAGRAVVLKVDTEEHPGLAARFRVQGIPNFLVLVRGRPVVQQPGLVDHRQLKRWLEEAAAAA